MLHIRRIKCLFEFEIDRSDLQDQAYNFIII
jgi:hypothetical protein